MEFKTQTLRLPGTGNYTEVATIVYGGTNFTADGATITDTHATVYIHSDKRKGDVFTFGGDVIGTYVETGKWKRRHPVSGVPWTIRTVRVTLNDGRTYVGRYGPDNSQAVRLRRIKGELTDA